MNKFSNYLKKKKPLLKKLIEKLSEDFEFASVLSTDVKGKDYIMDKQSTTIMPAYISECGNVLRVFKNGVYYEYSFNEIEEKDIDKIINNVKELSIFANGLTKTKKL